ncbi:tetratricopeptide repeat protein [Cupriavidus pauculus]|uniref:tetratricopeptide repeat protein n=1 Tax=Cupriavidus pauculus TaxID=82633 RepID=UPI001EE17B25|nr:tetratricopeptide repeat protein [Cupriavidus pauculus]GJG95479.1 tetratricopeptide repeat protein [Cupriavidus pauculus]
MQAYSTRDVQALLGISRTVITALIASGVIAPRRGTRREYRFSFQDVVLLRTAQSLREAGIPTRHVTRSLRRLQGLGEGRPPTGMRVTAVGGDVAVQDRRGRWHVDSGQFVLDLDDAGSPPASAEVVEMRRDATLPAARAEPPETDPAAWFERGVALERTAPGDAEFAYRQAVAQAPDYLDAWLNLGCLLSDHHRVAEAIAEYRTALSYLPSQPLIHFNLGVALEDAGAQREALESYHACIALAPDFADAHYNAARLHEALGDPHRAIRHYNQYRKLEPVM